MERLLWWISTRSGVDLEGEKNHWKGRTCKVYTKLDSEWKLIIHTGVPDFENMENTE